MLNFFIHISSIAAVEENERNEVLTENSVGNPQSHYGKSKKAAEEYLLKQILPSGKKLFILRPSMIHGKVIKKSHFIVQNYFQRNSVSIRSFSEFKNLYFG